MKFTSFFPLVGMGAIAVAATLALPLPSHAKPKVTVTTTPGPTVNSAGDVVIPIGNSSGATPSGGVVCVPGSPTPCGAPVAIPPGLPSAAPAPSGMVCVPGGPAPCAPQPIARDYFFCGRDPHGRPTTYVNTPTGNLPLVRWVSHYFNESGYTPEVRCREVSQRFNQFYNQGVLNFITTGFINNLPVVCVAGRMGGPCTNVLFTLKSGQNATRTIQQLFDVRAGAAGPLFESDGRVYIDMRPYTTAIQANQADR